MNLFTYHVFSLWRSSSQRILKTKTKQNTRQQQQNHDGFFGRQRRKVGSRHSTLEKLIFEQRYMQMRINGKRSRNIATLNKHKRTNGYQLTHPSSCDAYEILFHYLLAHFMVKVTLSFPLKKISQNYIGQLPRRPSFFG